MRTFCILFLISGFFLGWPGWESFLQTASAQTSRPVEPRQAYDQRVELANLKADIQVLDRRLREMNIAMEDLALRNRQLAAELEQTKRQATQASGGVRHAQLDQAINQLRQQIQAASSEQRRQILKEVTQQIEALGNQTQAAIDTLARSVSARPGTTATPQQSFSEDFPKEGVSYTVQAGDTLSGIASRHNSTIRDIQNANQISNPASIQIGQTLFIPQRNN